MSDDTDFLRSLAAHVDKHDLNRTASNASPPLYANEVGAVLIYPTSGGTHTAVLVRWLGTLGEPSVTAQVVDDLSTHLRAAGMLDDGVAVTVTVVLGKDERDLLAANCDLRKGVTIPVDLLRSLVDAHIAEEPGSDGAA